MAEQNKRVIRSPRGTKLNAKYWATEAPLRMLMNNLDPDVAERPDDLVVYGGIGKAARNWDCFDRIISVLKRLELDETLLVQSGKPVGVVKTHPGAPRVMIANANLVPHWANWKHFNELDRAGLMMYGQMTAGSWIYIGSQGIIQGTYETFTEIGRRHFGGDLSGRLILTGGLGGRGGAQPLAATMAGACMLAVECQSDRIDFRKRTGYLNQSTASLDEALKIIDVSQSKGEAVSVGLLGNVSEVFPEIMNYGLVPDVVTDQTAAHDPVFGYLPEGWTVEQWKERQKSDSDGVMVAAKKSMAKQVSTIIEFKKRGSIALDYGNNIRQMAFEEGVEDAFCYPGFVEAYVRPLFCQGKGPFRWVALSGDPEDIFKTDKKVLELFPKDEFLVNWINKAEKYIPFQGLPARICWLGLGARHKFGLAINEMVRTSELTAPIVIGRDHMDSGSVASPNRETEGMLDGSDAVSDWPILNLMLNTSCGANWVSFHHGGGVCIGYSQHAGFVVLADGSKQADENIRRLLWNDPASGVIRHADAGYIRAIQCAQTQGLDLPCIDL